VVVLGSEPVVVLPLLLLSCGQSVRCVPSVQVVFAASLLELMSGLLLVASGWLVAPASARRLVPEVLLPL
jgi:ABC-type transport system involved in cytochrome bd biosynthesis fused ATPase/permease subunit